MCRRILLFSLLILAWGKTQSQDNSLIKKYNVVFSAFEKPNNSRAIQDYYWHNASRGYPVFLNPRGTKIKIEKPTFLIEASSAQIPYLIYPGEKIRISDTGKFLEFSIVGNTERSNELSFFRSLVQRTGNIYKSGFNPPVYYTRRVKDISSVKKNEKIINQILRKRLYILDSLLNIGSLNKTFADIAENFIRCKALADTLDLISSNRNLLLKGNIFDDLIKNKVRSINRIPFSPFQFYFRCCKDVLMTAVFKNPNYDIQNLKDFLKAFEFTKNNFNGGARDYAMFYCLNAGIRNLLSIKKRYFDVFYEKCKNEDYKSIISKKLIEQKTRISSGVDMVISAETNKPESIQEVLKRDSGKIIVLDFWASWCAPCRAEIPFSKKLLTNFQKGRVTFIYISVDEDPGEWKDAIDELNLRNERSYRFVRGNADFIRKFNIVGVPRYLVINKEGYIINDDAPRPSDSRLKLILAKLILEK